MHALQLSKLPVILHLIHPRYDLASETFLVARSITYPLSIFHTFSRLFVSPHQGPQGQSSLVFYRKIRFTPVDPAGLPPAAPTLPNYDTLRACPSLSWALRACLPLPFSPVLPSPPCLTSRPRLNGLISRPHLTASELPLRGSKSISPTPGARSWA